VQPFDRTRGHGRRIVGAIRAAFVFQNPRQELLAEVRAGREPDTALLGLNHLAAFGIAADVHDPRLLRRKRGGLLERFLWSAREVPLPWELWWAEVAFTPLANLFPLAARVHGAPPVVCVNYGLVTIYDRSSRARQKLLARSLRSCAAVVCLGASQREDTIERCRLAPERVHTVPVGVDIDWFAPRSEPDAEPYLLTVGKDLARDLQTLAAAVAELDTRVEIVAHPRNLAGVTLPANARVRSFISTAELRDLYAAAACVVVPQRADGYPYGSEGGGLTTVCEAMAMAKPVIATERAILRDYLDEDELVPPEDPDALRAAIERVLADPGERGERSRRRAEQRHSTRHFAEQLAPILRAAAT
jgi:glycosyltransferase involved in cell wall biosynthesis